MVGLDDEEEKQKQQEEKNLFNWVSWRSEWSIEGTLAGGWLTVGGISFHHPVIVAVDFIPGIWSTVRRVFSLVVDGGCFAHGNLLPSRGSFNFVHMTMLLEVVG